MKDKEYVQYPAYGVTWTAEPATAEEADRLAAIMAGKYGSSWTRRAYYSYDGKAKVVRERIREQGEAS